VPTVLKLSGEGKILGRMEEDDILDEEKVKAFLGA